MKFVKNKTIASFIALFLVIIITATIVPLITVNAHTPPWTFPTNAYAICSPSHIGLGQYTTIVVWVDRYSPTAGGGTGQRWNGFKIDITKPDGTNVTIGPFQCSSDVGNDFKTFTPDKVGTYTIVFSWPGETAVSMPGNPSTSANIGDYYAGSTSAPTTLVVEQEPVADWQEPPLPTDYWSTPINDANRGWSALASNWLKGTWLVNDFQRWGKAPESAHVLWTKPITPTIAGGILDAQWPGIPANVNDYEAPWSTPIIMNGKIYINTPPVSDIARYGYYCMDLYTGEQIWYKNGTDNGLNNPFTIGSSYDLGQYYIGGSSTAATGALTQGQLYNYDSVNGNGILSYLIMVQGTTWYFLDANGNFLLKLINVPSGTAVTDQDGSLLRYSYNPTTGNLLCWNSSQSIPPLGPLGTNQQQWKMRFGATIDAVNDTTWTTVGASSTVPADAIRPRSGYTMNITVQKNLPGSLTILQDDNRVPKEIFGSYIATAASTSGSSPSADTFSAWLMSIDEHVSAYSPFPQFSASQNTNLGFGATLLWNKEFQVPLPGKNYTWSIGGVSYDDQIFILNCQQTMQLWGYSLTTGALVWGPTPAPSSPFDYYGYSSNIYYGKILSTGLGGALYAFDAKTGELLWNYNATNVGRESPYGDNYPLSISAVCDGKVYMHSTEHSPTKPLWRGSYVRCVNLTDGTEIWKLLDYASAGRYASEEAMGIANGYLVTGNQYDNNIYCIGKGPSATTVSAPQTDITLGQSVTITGTVTDQSPGALKLGAKGAAAIDDASQEAWMEYLYEQQSMPLDATGVPVSLDTMDPNGNFVHIGTVTSDITGGYGYSWKPEVPGTYQIIANFKGSTSYGSSSAQTYMSVSEAAPTASPIPVVNLPPTEMYIIAGVTTIIIAIAIGFAVTILVLKKRP
jgi:outer membrane protein assembly factor BamB